MRKAIMAAILVLFALQTVGCSAIRVYGTDKKCVKGVPFYTKKTYYIKYGNNIMGILGSSPTNQYSDKWIEAFDEIVQTFQFTK